MPWVDKALTFVGLLLTFLGALMLFVRGVWQKKHGNVIVTPDGEVMQFEPDAAHPDIPQAEWQPLADVHIRHGQLLNVGGFALVSLGTLVQMVALRS
jgi:uncharacterized membrane protein